MRRPFLLSAMVLSLALGAAACGGDDEKSEAEIKAELSDTLQSGGTGLDEEAADCFAEIVIDEVGVEELRDVDLTADEPPAELQADITAAATRAAEECDIAGAAGADG